MLTLIFMQLSRLISCCKIHNNLQSGDLEIIEFKPLLHRTGQVHRVDSGWWVMFGSSFTAEQQQPTVTVHSVVIITSFLLTITVTGLHCDVHSYTVSIVRCSQQIHSAW